MDDLFAPFSTANLQGCAAVVQMLADAGHDAQSALAAIKKEVTGRVGQVVPGTPAILNAAAQPCPSPGCGGVLRHCPESSALAGSRVLVCSRHCGYSRLEGV